MKTEFLKHTDIWYGTLYRYMRTAMSLGETIVRHGKHTKERVTNEDNPEQVFEEMSRYWKHEILYALSNSINTTFLEKEINWILPYVGEYQKWYWKNSNELQKTQHESSIFSDCILLWQYAQYTEAKIRSYFPEQRQKDPKPIPPQLGKTQLTTSQIALMYIYDEKAITRRNADEIAKQYGHSSGEHLFQRFTYYSSAGNRKAKETTKRKQQNKIKLIESVISLLANDQRAKDELTILRKPYR